MILVIAVVKDWQKGNTRKPTTLTHLHTQTHTIQFVIIIMYIIIYIIEDSVPFILLVKIK